MQQYPLQIENLSRYFDRFCALESVDLILNKGEITILSGPNGAGKSTFLQCISGLLRPTSGHIRVSGFNFYSQERQAKRHLAFVPDVPRFYHELTAWEHLKFMAAAHNVLQGFNQRAETMLKKYGLWDARNLFPHHYSRGMRLKLGLLLAFIRPFDVLILDEPTSALDSESTQLLAESLQKYRSQGKAVLLSSHQNRWIEPVSDRFLEMHAGKIQEI